MNTRNTATADERPTEEAERKNKATGIQAGGEGKYVLIEMDGFMPIF